MVANRMDPNAKPEESGGAAAAPAAAAAAPAAGGGIKAWLPLIVVILAMPALAFAMTKFVLVPQVQKALGTPAAPAAAEAKGKNKEAKAAEDAKKETVIMNKLLVNVAGTMGARFLLVSLTIEGSDADFKGKMTAHDPQLRDMAQGALSTKTLADLEKPGARNVIRSELISGFNNILGGAIVQNIYLTEFAIQ